MTRILTCCLFNFAHFRAKYSRNTRPPNWHPQGKLMHTLKTPVFTYFTEMSSSEQLSRVGWSDSDSVACFDPDGLASQPRPSLSRTCDHPEGRDAIWSY
jgi:hypothetical protein